MTAKTLVYDFIICTMQYLIVTRFFSSFLDRRKLNLWTVSLCVAGAAAVLTVVNQFHVIQLNVVTSSSLTLLLIALLFQGPALNKALLAAFAVGIAMGIENAMLAVVSTILGTKIASVVSSSEIQFAYSIINQSVLLLVLTLIAGLFGKVKYSSKDNLSAGLLVLPIASMINGFVMILLDRWVPPDLVFVNLLISLSCFILLVANIIGFHIYDKSMERHELKAKNAMLERSHKAQIAYYQNLKSHIEETTILRHDFTKHLATIGQMVTSGSDQVLDYIDRLADTVKLSKEMILSFSDVKNPVINAIFTHMADTCLREGIAFEVTIGCDDLEFLDSVDCVALLSNALDNAYEACIRSAGQEPLFIRVHIYNVKAMVFIAVDNTNTTGIRENDKGLVTSKKDPELHGLGLRSMQDAAAKYAGTVNYVNHIKENCFSLIIRLESPKSACNVQI